jgi:hypothetical protein
MYYQLDAHDYQLQGNDNTGERVVAIYESRLRAVKTTALEVFKFSSMRADFRENQYDIPGTGYRRNLSTSRKDKPED